MQAAAIKFVYRHVSDLELDRHSALSDANCASDHSDWRPAKPRMQEKLLAADLQVGMFMSFTEDGWNTFKYKMTEEYKDCILFRHYQNRYRSLLFKKVGGPVLSFDCVDDQSDGITCKLIMSATGEQIFEAVMPRQSMFIEFLSQAKQDPLVQAKLTRWDWHDKQVFTLWGEEISHFWRYDMIWRAHMANANGLIHWKCGCDKSKRQRLR